MKDINIHIAIEEIKSKVSNTQVDTDHKKSAMQEIKEALSGIKIFLF